MYSLYCSVNNHKGEEEEEKVTSRANSLRDIKIFITTGMLMNLPLVLFDLSS